MTMPLCRVPIILETAPRIIAMAAISDHGRRDVERYRHDGFWCLNLYDGPGELRFDDHCLPFKPGYASITRPGRENSYHFSGRTFLTWVHFMPATIGTAVAIPAMCDLGRDFTTIRRGVQDIAGLSDNKSPRAMAKVWEILWHLSELFSARESDEHAKDILHPALRLAITALGGDLARPVSVSDLAQQLEISQSQLNRLFQARFGTTVGGYWRHLRMERACHLLTNTTKPIAQIARHVGVLDAHHFNKMMRQHTGVPPRVIREHGLPPGRHGTEGS